MPPYPLPPSQINVLLLLRIRMAGTNSGGPSPCSSHSSAAAHLLSFCFQQLVACYFSTCPSHERLAMAALPGEQWLHFLLIVCFYDSSRWVRYFSFLLLVFDMSLLRNASVMAATLSLIFGPRRASAYPKNKKSTALALVFFSCLWWCPLHCVVSANYRPSDPCS